MVTLRVDVRTKSKLFAARVPGINRIAGEVVRELIKLGLDRLDEILRPRPAGVYLSVSQAGRNKASTGHFRRSVNAVHSKSASRIQSNVIYGPWLEGVSSRNQATRFRGYSMFRKTGQEIEKMASPLLEKRVNKFIRSLG